MNDPLYYFDKTCCSVASEYCCSYCIASCFYTRKLLLMSCFFGNSQICCSHKSEPRHQGHPWHHGFGYIQCTDSVLPKCSLSNVHYQWLYLFQTSSPVKLNVQWKVGTPNKILQILKLLLAGRTIDNTMLRVWSKRIVLLIYLFTHLQLT